MMGLEESNWDEHWVLYETVKSLYRTLKANIALYVNYPEFR